MEIYVLNEYVDQDVAGVEIYVETYGVLDTPPFSVKAHAKRDPIDKPNENTALTLAYGRAFEKIGQKLLKRAEGFVRHADNEREQKQTQKSRSKLSDLITRQPSTTFPPYTDPSYPYQTTFPYRVWNGTNTSRIGRR